jgi:hypothetical protein
VAALCTCLRSEQRSLQKEAAWSVANIAGGTLQHKQAVATPQLIAAAAALLGRGAFDVKKEAGFALANMCAAPGGELVQWNDRHGLWTLPKTLVFGRPVLYETLCVLRVVPAEFGGTWGG